MALQTQDFEYVKTNQDVRGVETSSQLGFVNSQEGNFKDTIIRTKTTFYLVTGIIKLKYNIPLYFRP